MADRPQDEVTLKIGGQRFGGWKEIDIQIDLDAGASSFDLAVTKRDPERNEDWRIEADQPCQVSIGSDLVIDGYVDRLEGSLDGNSHSIRVSGRSRTADLIDCSAIANPGSWRGRRLEDIANELAKPFGIQIKAEAPTGAPVRLFALQSGETAFEAIARLCQHRGLLPVPQPDGSVKLLNAKPTGGTARIVQGEHLLRVSGFHDVTDRFSQYVVKGQSAGDDEIHGKAASAPKGEARDPAVKRNRPLLIIADEQTDAASARKRAEWEANTRDAKSQGASATLDGWRRPDGKLWEIMNSVDLDAPAVWINDRLMVGGVQFFAGEQGRGVTLRLVRPEAYSQLPVPEDAKASKIKRKSRRSRKEREREEDDD